MTTSRECPHGIVVGVCNWCLAQSLEVEQAAIELIRRDVYEREMAEAEARTKRRRAREGHSK